MLICIYLHFVGWFATVRVHEAKVKLTSMVVLASISCCTLKCDILPVETEFAARYKLGLLHVAK